MVQATMVQATILKDLLLELLPERNSAHLKPHTLFHLRGNPT